MLKFKCIRYKNLLATGNDFIEIDLNRSPSTLIYGRNGNGKSTIIEALSFVLYNKPFRKINKPQLINTITNKNLLVEIEFSNYGADYLVRRGIKPTIFEIYKNGDLLDTSHSSQEYLEETILRINHRSFCNIYILGSASYIPFMELKPDQRRAIIENLLDLQIFSTMNILLKDRVNGNKQELADASTELKILNAEIEQIERLIQYNNEFFQKRLDEIKSLRKVESDKLDRLNEDIRLLTDVLEPLCPEDSIVKRIRQIEDLISKTKYKITDIGKESKFFELNHSCSVCRQTIDDNHKASILAELTEKNEKLQSAMEQLTTKLLEGQNELKKIKASNLKRNEQNNKMQALKNEQFFIKSKIQDFDKESGELDRKLLTTSQEFNIINKKVELNQKRKKIDDLEIQKKVYLISQNLLKDTGVKAQIIAEYIPLINELINKYLDAMNFMVSFELSETFEETIKSRYRDTFSYNSFSEGEKFRINLAILFTWRDIARLRNSVSSNLLIMDEVLDSSLDDDGIDDFFKILGTLDEETNVFVISHKPEQVVEKFDSVIEFTKVKNFSKMEYIDGL